MGSRGQVKKNPAARQRQSSILSAFLNLQRVRQTELYRKCWMSLLHTYETNFKIDSCPFKKKSIQLFQFNESPNCSSMLSQIKLGHFVIVWINYARIKNALYVYELFYLLLLWIFSEMQWWLLRPSRRLGRV